MEITSNIYLVGDSENTHPTDASVYLIKSKGEAALIDSGSGKGHNKLIHNIQNTGVSITNLKYLFLTHCHYDHSGGADMIRKLSGCQIVAHELDAAFLEEGNNAVTAAAWYGERLAPFKIDIKVSGRTAEFTAGDIDIKFYHTPGHSPGSSVLTAVSEGKTVLFGQDVHGPLNDIIRSNRDDYENSLDFLVSLEADIICEGHFGVFFGKEVVKDFIESYM